MSRPVNTKSQLHPLLAERWSPRALDPNRPVGDAQLLALLEAATWAPSCSNLQPWRFLVGRRGESGYDRLYEALDDFNRLWAHTAPLLLVGVAQTEDGQGEPMAYGAYDLGQALAHLTVQATAEGLYVHQMAGFSADAVREAFAVPAGFVPQVAVAVGYLGDVDQLPERMRKGETRPRERRPLEQSAFTGGWGQPAV